MSAVEGKQVMTGIFQKDEAIIALNKEQQNWARDTSCMHYLLSQQGHVSAGTECLDACDPIGALDE